MIDPALAALDFAKAGAILADMVMSYLTAGASPSYPERASEHDAQRLPIVTCRDRHASTFANQRWPNYASIRRARIVNTT